MKRPLISLLAFSLVMLVFTSCNSENTDSPESSNFNYWKSNALNRMQLNGPVKSLSDTTDATTVYEFNTDGNLTAKTIQSYATTEKHVFTYENSRLKSDACSTTIYVGTEVSSEHYSLETYEYWNTGKFIPATPFHFFDRGLIPDLSAKISAGARTDYKFQDSDLLIITSYSQFVSDTIKFHYEGDYPQSSVQNETYIENLTFYPNGMFKTYSEGYTGVGFDEKLVFTPLFDTKYQLTDKIGNVFVNEGVTRTYVRQFTYNDRKFMVSEATPYFINEWSDYQYDKHGNWISRKFRYKDGDTDWSTYKTQTRKIVYY